MASNSTDTSKEKMTIYDTKRALRKGEKRNRSKLGVYSRVLGYTQGEPASSLGKGVLREGGCM